eukprot:CAMPEP_0196824774 /NCGR_PEP_ID=MMETSP1362-20130617/92678_1 /TAXON_ID=163516 /ORGANISM="Leptocylindrus danicus, Strain CCMP1856" /LENGTH=291 /DNA_ID=CAMNT_0042205109 /DNA_START=59 /DNA_END=934 /DNA_ORIENTATION=-
MDASEKKKNEIKIKSIAIEEGALYQMMTDTLNDPKKRIIDLKIEDMVGASYQRMTDILKTAEETVAIGLKISCPSNKPSRDWSKEAGDDKEKEYIKEDEDWSGDKEQQGGIVNAAPRDGNKLDLDSTLQLNRRALPQEGIKLVHVLNIDEELFIQDETREQSKGGNDDKPWRKTLTILSVVVVVYFMRMRMRMEDEDEFVYFCYIETNKLRFIRVYLKFINISPFLLLRISRKIITARQPDYEQQPSPLPTKTIKNNQTPTQHIATPNQQRGAIIAWNELRWIQPLCVEQQ